MHDSSPASFFPDFAAFQRHLDARGMFRINPGLERIAGLLDRLGLTRPPFVAVQVVGTNGKGSTATMLAGLAQTHGLKVGLYTSPHLVSVRERIRVDGVMASEATLLRGLEPIMAAGGAELTYFELLTALAVQVFSNAGVDLAVLESGLGGTWDAVTAVDADLTLFTPIDMDHAQILGPTVAHIARDKAGAVRPGVPVLSGPQRPEAVHELTETAREKGSPLRMTVAEPWPDGFDPHELGLAGPHQVDNARLALAAWRLLGARKELRRNLVGSFPDAAAESKALRAARIPGRLQRVAPCPPAMPGEGTFVPCALGRPALILDGAHNPHGMAALGRALAVVGVAPAATVFACMADKDVDELIAHVRVAAVGGPIIVPRLADNERAMPAEELAGKIGLNAEAAPSVREALRLAAEVAADRLPESFTEPETLHPVLVCGSLYLLGEVFALWPDLLEPVTR
jgi:dihydrofolate synthase/folylpolyglutamate synthase